MAVFRLLANSYFDGERNHPATDGPYLIELRDGTICSIAHRASDAPYDEAAEFVMPGLVEAHAHIFLDGCELDLAERNKYFKASHDEMLAVARENVRKSASRGITLIRDAGDRYGINDALRDEQQAARVKLRSPGLGLKRPKRYGGFMAFDIPADGDCAAAVFEIAPRVDDIKVILTGIVDFAERSVKGAPQFSAEELSAIVGAAHARGKKTFAHCSGLAGLEVAVAARVDSIEHGYFMTRDLLMQIADKGIAWVPTVSPVQFQWERPEIAGWPAEVVDNLRRILDSHLEHIAIAQKLGVELIAGSDSGSLGVDHGAGLIAELKHFLAAGLSMREALISATSRPRRLWNAPAGRLQPGARADMIALARSPFEAADALDGPMHFVAT